MLNLRPFAVRGLAMLGLASLVLVAVQGIAPTVAGAAPARDCKATALDLLRRASPAGYAIYELIPDKRFFTGWVRCDEAQLSLPTAVHESVHFITAESDAYPMIDGPDVRRPPESLPFFPPSRIAGGFKRSIFADTYLRRGGASSATEFRYLLDELNAYTHDLHTALNLMVGSRDGGGVMHRDGLSALMAFTATYVRFAEASEPETWRNLRRPEVLRPVAEIWRRAETVMSASCRIPNIGHEDRKYLAQLCQPEAQKALSTLLGRPAVCPSACLEPEPRTAEAH